MTADEADRIFAGAVERRDMALDALIRLFWRSLAPDASDEEFERSRAVAQAHYWACIGSLRLLPSDDLERRAWPPIPPGLARQIEEVRTESFQRAAAGEIHPMLLGTLTNADAAMSFVESWMGSDGLVTRERP